MVNKIHTWLSSFDFRLLSLPFREGPGGRLFVFILYSFSVAVLIPFSAAVFTPAHAQQPQQTQYEYDIMVYEHPSTHPLTIERELTTAKQKGFFSAVLDVYRSTFTGKVVDLSAQIIQAGVNLIIRAAGMQKENYNNWQKTTKSELYFAKTFPMQNEISDFYQAPSTVGALDPDGIIFKGFGCKQYVIYHNDSVQTRIPVLIMACSIDSSETGKQRIQNHSKFQVVVDSIIFNPFLCNIPNDSLNLAQIEENMRIPFDFQRRKNLHFGLHADFFSSWMNEAIMVFHDQYLGAFDIDFTIPDSTVLDSVGHWKGYYTWYRSRDEQNTAKPVTVSGDCFIVPRSYIGIQSPTSNIQSPTSYWGTGQYRINMSFTEACELNETYYFDENKKPNSNWKAEWKQIKRRKRYPTVWDDLAGQFSQSFDIQNHQWVHTFLDPVQQVIIVDETQWLNTIMKVETPTQNAQQ